MSVDSPVPAEVEIGQTPFFSELDLGGALYQEEEIEMVVNELKRRKLYDDDLLYRGFNGKRLSLVDQTGTDSPERSHIFLVTEKEWRESFYDSVFIPNPVEYAYYFPVPALSVYRGKLLEAVSDYEYEFSNKSDLRKALVGVFSLKG